ncbi:hypothetical protein Golob_025835 [Gossypium lobatum]|uniref:Uncharacterized protein n=1 Tax=Gossypium lobatum TaxID=34289 RepID=A0A7J8LTA0_9ROSI|nr:hypothetical protein [Gossypium lobatum]
MIKELKEALRFAASISFWRMAVFWTISLFISYFQLHTNGIFSRRLQSYPRCHPPISESLTPVCIITGATSGLGAAAAHALSREGFFVVLGTLLCPQLISFTFNFLDASRSILARETRTGIALLECPLLASQGSLPARVFKLSISLDIYLRWFLQLDDHRICYQRYIDIYTIMTEIKTQNKDAHVKAFVVDLASFQSILEFKSSLQQWLLDCKLHCSLQLLINNAGILATSSRTTPEGYDHVYCQLQAVRYLGCYDDGYDVDKESVYGTRFLRSEQYPFARLYEYSKLFLILFSYELHRQLGLMDQPYHVSVNAADPGSVKTDIMREVPSCLSSLAFQVLKSLGLLQSPKNGVSSLIDAALAPPKASGVYFFGGKGRTVDSSVLSHNSKLAKELWDISDNLFMEASLAFKETASSESDNWL